RINGGADPAESTYEVVAEQLWGLPPGAGTDEAVAAIRRHELIARILDHSHHAISIADLAERVLPADHGRQPAETEQFLVHVLGALSHLRATVTAADPNAGRRLPTIAAHLWVRALSRLDRTIRATLDFPWPDRRPPPTHHRSPRVGPRTLTPGHGGPRHRGLPLARRRPPACLRRHGLHTRAH